MQKTIKVTSKLIEYPIYKDRAFITLSNTQTFWVGVRLPILLGLFVVLLDGHREKCSSYMFGGINDDSDNRKFYKA